MCGPRQARYRVKMFTAEFSSLSMTKPQFVQRYVRFHNGMSCLFPQMEHILEVYRSSKKTSSFPYNLHLYVSISKKVESPHSL